MDQDKTFAQLMGENKSGHDPDVRTRSRRAGYPIVESATMDEGTADALLAMIVEVPRDFKEDE
jgi:hypothetical protein